MHGSQGLADTLGGGGLGGQSLQVRQGMVGVVVIIKYDAENHTNGCAFSRFAVPYRAGYGWQMGVGIGT